ncbi:hypothetical protein EU514_01495 [Pseudomonas fragi]|nr:hypothetical protein [Pseudomonas fragi]
MPVRSPASARRQGQGFFEEEVSWLAVKCGSGLARDAYHTVSQDDRSDAIASKPAPTLVCGVCRQRLFK